MNLNHADNLTITTQALKAAHVHAAQTAATAARDKSNLQANENALILEGVEGKNEAERKARLAEGTLSDRVTLERSEQAHREAQLALTLAELDHKLARELAALHRAELGANNS